MVKTDPNETVASDSFAASEIAPGLILLLSLADLAHR